MSTIILSATRKAILEELIGTGNVLDPANISVGLIAGNHSWSAGNTRDDVLAAETNDTDFPGYATIAAPNWAAPSTDGNFNWFTDLGLMEFITNADPPAPVTITAYFIDTGTLAIVIELDQPVVISRESQAVKVIPPFAYGQ